MLGVAILSALSGFGAFALYEAEAISSNTSANFGLVSLGSALAVAVIGFGIRRRVRLAREAMFVGLATLGAWFLLLVYALGRDTP
jgi:hypothetical protein